MDEVGVGTGEWLPLTEIYFALVRVDLIAC